MVSFSGQAVSATEDILAAAVARDVAAFEAGMEKLLLTYRKINEVMETMWGRSKPSDYLAFRTFIFGTAPKQGNPMFPRGVRYEGVREEPYALRGESGANDSLVPLSVPGGKVISRPGSPADHHHPLAQAGQFIRDHIEPAQQ